MTKQTEFQKQLSDPRWQKKRLEILERDEWTCQTCGDTKATLTVHHKSYRMTGGKFADVWDYDGGDLITLCETCHKDEETELIRVQKDLFFRARDIFNSSTDIDIAFKRLATMKKDYGRLDNFDFLIIRSSAKDNDELEFVLNELRSIIEVKNETSA